jgi:hypothetical protein
MGRAFPLRGTESATGFGLKNVTEQPPRPLRDRARLDIANRRGSG